MKMEYIRLAEGLTSYKLIPSNENIWNHIKNPDKKDYYISLYKYNDEHYKQWKEKHSVGGFTGVVASKLYFDFDDATNPDNARKDALTVITRLLEHGLSKNAIQINFTGNKGFSVEVDTTEKFSPEEFKATVKALASDLKSFDPVVVDAQRLVRITGTKHQKSGLYKMPISMDQLAELPIPAIKELAKDYANVDAELIDSYVECQLPTSITKYKTPEVKNPVTTLELSTDIDLSKKPKWLSPAKFALQEGFFGSGERNLAFMILASSYKNQGFSKEIVYRMLKGVAERQATRNNSDRYADTELWNNVVKVVFSDTWKGGTYSYDNTPLLQEVTKRLGLKIDNEVEDKPKSLLDVTSKFKHYVKNIEKNTIKTGIKELDAKIFLSTGANVGLLGAPGSGKSSLALEILSNTSKQGIKSVFASLDMASTRIYEKILYRLTGKSRDELYKLYKEDKEHDLIKLVEKEFGNVFFFDKSSPSVADIRAYIKACEEASGEKIKLVMIDYFERLGSDKNDDTAASKEVAGQLQDLVNDLDICLITLVQPNKMSGDMSTPIYSYTNIKGSSFLAQSFRVIFSVYREGFSPKDPYTDKYLTINILKNDLGEPASIDFAWEGKRGLITSLDSESYRDLQMLRQEKEATKKDDF